VSEKSFRINQPQVVHEAFDDEVVIVNLDTGNYYSLEGAGADIWREIEVGAGADEIVEATIRRYDGPSEEIRSAVRELLRDLEREELVSPGNVADPAARDRSSSDEAATNQRPPFLKPVLTRFTDMQELLLLDPVHDVDETGWPRPRDAADNAAP